VVMRRATTYLGMYDRPDVDTSAVANILEGWQDRQPKFILVIPDHTSRGQPYNFTVPAALFQRLEGGRDAYRRAAYFHTPPLVPWLSPPPLDYPVVNPPIRVYARADTVSAAPARPIIWSAGNLAPRKTRGAGGTNPHQPS
jgi:hypothetical protein